jgi:tRNA(Met) cytidine acetyltransferase
MLPDVLTSQLRDEAAAVPVGYRVVRIATHHAVRDRGLGSLLLDAIAADVEPDESGTAGDTRAATLAGTVDPERRLDTVDWLGVGYGATPELLRFWAANGYSTVHFSTTRNQTSGEYSAIMLKSVTEDGAAVLERHGRQFRDRVAGLLSDPVRDADPDVVRALLRTIPAPPDLQLSEYEQRVATGAAYGPGLSDVAPGVFRDLALAGFLAAPSPGLTRADSTTGPLATIDTRERRLLVRKCLQAHRWSSVADELGYVSRSDCLRTFGQTMQPLVDAFCGAVAEEDRERYTD